MDAATREAATKAARRHGADERLVALEQAQILERRGREALPLRAAEAFESSCLRSDHLQEEMLALPAATREGLAVKFRELVYALRHHLPVEPWVESLRRDFQPGRDSRQEGAPQEA